jgi:hypothetical protein
LLSMALKMGEPGSGHVEMRCLLLVSIEEASPHHEEHSEQ